MWSNHSNGRFRGYRKAANVKGYLGGFSTLDEEHDQDDTMSYGDVSSLGGLSTLDTVSIATGTDYRSTSSSSNSPVTDRSSTKHRHSKQPSVLVEIPENFPRELDGHHHSHSSIENIEDNGASSPPSIDDLQDEESVSVTNQKIAEIKRRWHERAQGKDDSSAMVEIEKNLDDMDNYLLSIYMNDDASIYTRATADSSFSSASSVSSTLSTRQRHRGAHSSRRRVSKRAQERKGTWVDSMRESSTNFFVDGEGGWTPLRGWSIKPKKTWDPQPDERWKGDSLNVFETVAKERLEI